MMDTAPLMLRSILSSSAPFDRLFAIGWEDIGGVVLAVVAITLMSVVGAIRSR